MKKQIEGLRKMAEIARECGIGIDFIRDTLDADIEPNTIELAINDRRYIVSMDTPFQWEYCIYDRSLNELADELEESYA